MIKTIFFDFGNVLVTYDKVFNKICDDFKLNCDDLLEFYSLFHEQLTIGEMETSDFWKKCIEHYTLDKEKIKEYDFEGSWVADYEIIKPINSLINELKEKINIGIISNINSGIWEAALKDSWVPNINYVSIILSYKVASIKPNREIYELAQIESQVNPDEILFVDDKEINLIEPTKMGWKTILFDPNKAEDGVKKIRSIISG